MSINFFKRKKGNKNYKKFVILSTARTGSDLLYSYLNSHPNVICFREIFGQKDSIDFGNLLTKYRSLSKNKKTLEFRMKNPIDFLNKYIFSFHEDIIHAVGFKLFYYHPNTYENWNEIKKYLEKDKSIKIIHLKRENLLDVYFSLKKAHKTNQWNVWKNDSKKVKEQFKDFTIQFTEEECRFYFEKTEEYIRIFESLIKDHEVVDIYYNDLLNKSEEVLNKMQSFLDVEIHTLETRTNKVNKRSVPECIENYSELKKEFQNTPYSKYFIH
jgi:LPS sulfotransferase NodH